MTRKFIIVLLIILTCNSLLNATPRLIACDHAPSEDNPCELDAMYYVQFLDNINTQDNAVKQEKTLYYILTDVNELKTNEIVFKLFQTIDAKTFSYQFIKEIKVKVKEDWSFCWAKFVFDKPNDYWIRAYKNDVLIDEDFVSIHLKH